MNTNFSFKTDNLEVTPEIKAAIDAVNKGHNVFIHGRPGTGKSTFIQHLKEVLTVKSKNVMFVGATGMAALNVHGQTIHSFFRINPRDIHEPITYDVRGYLQKAWKTLDILVIDEASMIRADLFDVMDKRFQFVFADDRPFGNKQIVVVGDLNQLEPVLNQHSGLKQDQLCKENYKSSHIFDANCFKNLNFKHIFFTKVFRQQNEEFKKHLSFLEKSDDKHIEQALEYFNKRVCEKRPQEAVCLCAKKEDAAKINKEELDKLPAPTYRISAYLTSKALSDWAEKNCPAPRDLYLKIGAKVMFVKNDENKQFINGTVGYIKKINLADDLRIENIVVEVAGNREITVERSRWYKTMIDKHGRQVFDMFSFFSQFPIQLAWATTIHKAQGMTLDSCYVDMGKNGAFSIGQTYVALSRVREIEHLFLKNPITEADILPNKAVEEFFHSIQGV